jgi:carbonic anhydrase/acetyltransferase-like protein (isoleucine patch superfamily)
MSTFALDTNSSSADIIGGLNYAIANLGQGIAAATANVLTANITTGAITTTSSNSGGYTNTTVVSYLYEYMDVKYANSATGGSGFSSNSANKSYYGLRNTTSTTISSNPADYVWYQVTGGFGTTKGLYYQTIGGRQVAFFAGNAAPLSSFIPVPDNTALDLDTITSAQNNQIVNVNAYYQSNVAPATPAGGTYNFTNFTLTPPTSWSASVPTFVANTSVYISSAAFTGNSNATSVPPATNWTVPAVYTAPFSGNTGAPGARGFVPLGYVVAPSDPTVASDATLTSWFSASRANSSAPIGLGYAPIANDTAQFLYTDLFNPNNDVTLVKTFNGTSWSTVTAQVVSGGLIVPGTLTANTLNANQVYAITVQSTNANIGDITSNGYWFQANTGNARMAGTVSIGNNLTVGDNAQIGGNLNVGTSAKIGDSVTIGNSAVVGTNLTIGNSAVIGTNLTVGNNAVIGGNLAVSGLITQGNLANATVRTLTISPNNVSTSVFNSTVVQQTYNNIAQSTVYYYTNQTTSITPSYANQQILVTGTANYNLQLGGTGVAQPRFAAQLIMSYVVGSTTIYQQLCSLNSLPPLLNTSGGNTNFVGSVTLTAATTIPVALANPGQAYNFYIGLNYISPFSSSNQLVFTSGTVSIQNLYR